MEESVWLRASPRVVATSGRAVPGPLQETNWMELDLDDAKNT